LKGKICQTLLTPSASISAFSSEEFVSAEAFLEENNS
jgi:hypothetical protein